MLYAPTEIFFCVRHIQVKKKKKNSQQTHQQNVLRFFFLFTLIFVRTFLVFLNLLPEWRQSLNAMHVKGLQVGAVTDKQH